MEYKKNALFIISFKLVYCPSSKLFYIVQRNSTSFKFWHCKKITKTLFNCEEIFNLAKIFKDI